MKLYLDDMRPAPGGWTLAKNVEEAQAFLKTGMVEECSLDHDLGFQFDDDGNELAYSKTGYDLVKWMAETSTWPKCRPTVHSMNPVGKRNMLAMIERYFPKEED